MLVSEREVAGKVMGVWWAILTCIFLAFQVASTTGRLAAGVPQASTVLLLLPLHVSLFFFS